MNGRRDAPPALWSRFFAANRDMADRYFTPRLYPVTHVAAIDHWFRSWVGSDAFPAGRESILEFGCGDTFHLTRMVGDRFRRRCATDIASIDRSAWPAGVEFRECSATSIPFGDSEFDVVVVRSVFEHLERPDVTLAELDRILRPNGKIFLNLPNKWDYVSVGARVAGGWKSSALSGLMDPDWDDFPVYYRCNTRADLKRTLRGTNLSISLFRPVPSEPSYLRSFLPLYVAGAIYQFGISLAGLDFLQPAFFVVLTKAHA
jgi:SAM-dependent methyltransferase